MYSYYPEELIEEIRLNNDIVELVSDYLKLEKKGKDFFGLCPFHREKTPSFSVVPAKQIFYCFGCGKGGNVIHFVMNIENLEYIEAVRFLADRAKIQMPEGGSEEEAEKARIKQKILNINTEAARYFYNCLYLKTGEKARLYLKDRGISDNIAKRFGLGYSIEDWDGLYKHLVGKGYDEELLVRSGLILNGKKNRCYDRFRNRIIFPIFDIRGNVIGFGGRVTDSSLPKYINSPETMVYNKGKNLYAMNFAKNSNEKTLIVVEGYMDVISLHQRGIVNAVASLGTALTESQGRLLKKYADDIIISYDADTAGQAATLRGLDLLGDIGCNMKVLVIPEGKDPDEYIRRNGLDKFKRLMDNAVSLIEYKIKVLRSQVDTATTEGKIKFLNGVAGILARVDNGVEREMYIKKMADEYEITEEAIFSEVIRRTKPKINLGTKAINTGKVKKVEGEVTKDKQNERLADDERFLLALICIENGAYRLVKDMIDLDFFTNPDNRRIAEIIFERLENNAGIKPVELLNMLKKDTAGFFTKIFSEESYCDDINKAILGKIRSMKLYKNEKRLKEISELLQNNGSLKEGDVERLKHELKTLVMEIKKQKSG